MLNLYDMLFPLEPICGNGAELCENIIESLSNYLPYFKQLDKVVEFLSFVKVQLLVLQDILFQNIKISLRDVQWLLKVIWVFKDSADVLPLQDCVEVSKHVVL